jgi:phage-related tail protein
MNSKIVSIFLAIAFVAYAQAHGPQKEEESPFAALLTQLSESYEKGLKSFKETWAIPEDDKVFSSLKAVTAKLTEAVSSLAKNFEKDGKPFADELQLLAEKATTKCGDFVKKTLESPESKSKLDELKVSVEKLLKPLEEAIDKFGKSAGFQKPISVSAKQAVEDVVKNLEKFRIKTVETIDAAIQDQKKKKY